MTTWRRLSFASVVLLALHSGACQPQSESPTAKTADEAEAARARQANELFELGLGFSKAGDSVRAEHYLNAAIQAGYPEQRALPELIGVCVRAGRLRSALTYAEPALRKDPNDIKLRYLVGSLHLGLGHTSAAVRELRTVLTLAPNEARAHYLLGVTLTEQLHDEEQAATHFGEYLKLDPEGQYGAEVRLWLRQHQDAQGRPQIAQALDAGQTSLVPTRDAQPLPAADAPSQVLEPAASASLRTVAAPSEGTTP